MSSASDPIRLLRRRIIITGLVGLGAVSAITAWAWRTFEQPNLPDATLRPATAPIAEANAVAGLDPAAFNVVLWRVPPAREPVVEPAQERPPPAPRLTLVAIIRESDGTLRAALHDPDQDKLLMLTGGGRAGAWTVAKVTDEGVELNDGSRTTWLALRPYEKGGGR